MEDSLFNWGALATMGGASMLTFLIIQYTKSSIDQIIKIKTDLYAVIIAFTILSVAQIATGADATDWKTYGLAFANSFLIALASGKMHDNSANQKVKG